MAATKVSLKLLIDKKRHQVQFAEAGKKLIDFLISYYYSHSAGWTGDGGR